MTAAAVAVRKCLPNLVVIANSSREDPILFFERDLFLRLIVQAAFDIVNQDVRHAAIRYSMLRMFQSLQAVGEFGIADES
jgi:hypothetical protein